MFPRFDLAAFECAHQDARHGLARQLDLSCRDTGFLLLEGHGVASSVIDGWRLGAAAAELFFARTAAAKRAVALPYQGYPYGYLGPDAEALARSKGEETPPDLKESFNGGPRVVPSHVSDPDALEFCYVRKPFPDLVGFKPAWLHYYRAMENLAARMMRAFAVVLQLPEDHFGPFMGHPISALRALHYPATVSGDRWCAAGPLAAGRGAYRLWLADHPFAVAGAQG